MGRILRNFEGSSGSNFKKLRGLKWVDFQETLRVQMGRLLRNFVDSNGSTFKKLCGLKWVEF